VVSTVKSPIAAQRARSRRALIYSMRTTVHNIDLT